MYKVNEYLVYGKEVCKVEKIEEKKFNNEDYYLLKPIKDPSLTISAPINDKAGKIRSLITKEELEKIINSIPTIEIINSSDRFLEQTYKELLKTSTQKDLIKIIKTTYLRNKKRQKEKKPLAETDNLYFNLAEQYLYNEFKTVLGLSYDDTKNYVINRVLDLEKSKN